MEKGLTYVKEEGVVLLGAPIGSKKFEAEQIMKKVNKIRDITTLLPLGAVHK